MLTTQYSIFEKMFQFLIRLGYDKIKQNKIYIMEILYITSFTRLAQNEMATSLRYTAWKVSKYGVISSPYFPAFGPNTERYEVRAAVIISEIPNEEFIFKLSCKTRALKFTKTKLFHFYLRSTLLTFKCDHLLVRSKP